MRDDVKERGIRFVNDEGLPELFVEYVAEAKSHRAYRLFTAKSELFVRVTPSGLLRVDDAPRRR